MLLLLLSHYWRKKKNPTTSHFHSTLKPMLKISRRRQWQPTPVLLPEKSHGRSSLVGCSPWGRYESDRTERLHFHFSLSHIGEGNGNPLQCSCLENPRDGEVWLAVSMGSHRVRQDWSDLAAAAAIISTRLSHLPDNPSGFLSQLPFLFFKNTFENFHHTTFLNIIRKVPQKSWDILERFEDFYHMWYEGRKHYLNVPT